MLREEQRSRYGRNLNLPGFSEDDQERLLGSKVLLIGLGGLGSPISLYLAAMGVGHLTILDPDRVEVSNLQRQIVLDSDTIDQPKVEVAKRRLERLNPDISVEVIQGAFERRSARRYAKAHDMVVDASDNFQTKFLVNDACVIERRPFSIGSVLSFHGQVSTFLPGTGPCYRCLFRGIRDGAVPTASEQGILGTVPGVIGVIQATEVFKVLLGKGRPLVGRLLLVDVIDMDIQVVEFQRLPGCPACGAERTIELPE